jgi:CheY-like chemotaxis protein
VKVLIVEDSPLVRKMYGLVFPKRDHDVTATEDGRYALSALADSSSRYDLILLDLRMPNMDGVEFIRAVRSDAVFGRIPIVLTTAEAESSVLLQQARALGVAAVVRKPWKPQELRDVVQSIFPQPVG